MSLKLHRNHFQYFLINFKCWPWAAQFVPQNPCAYCTLDYNSMYSIQSIEAIIFNCCHPRISGSTYDRLISICGICETLNLVAFHNLLQLAAGSISYLPKSAVDIYVNRALLV